MPPRLVAVRLAPDAFIPTLHAVWAAGDAVLPLPAPTQGGTDSMAADAIARWRPHVVVDATGEHAGPAGATLPDDTALVVPTSGTTGAPRGVVLSHRALTASTTRSLVALGAATGEMFALVLPLHHIAGLQVVLRAWSCDTTPVVTDLGELAAGSAERVHVSFVAAQLAELLDRGVHPERFAKVLVGGGPVPDRLLTRARAAGLDVVTSYGMTETCGGCVYDGRPLPDIAVDAREGRLRIRGPVLADSYLDDPTPLRDTDGWFVTPDRGAVVDGRVIVHGRTDDVIVTGGENVDAILVADALRAHHAVRDAAVVGIDDARWGAIIAAAIVPTPGAHCDPESVVAFVRRQLPASHAPRRVVVVDALPVTTLDKVDRNAVRRLFDDRSDAVT